MIWFRWLLAVQAAEVFAKIIGTTTCSSLNGPHCFQINEQDVPSYLLQGAEVEQNMRDEYERRSISSLMYAEIEAGQSKKSGESSGTSATYIKRMVTTNSDKAKISLEAMGLDQRVINGALEMMTEQYDTLLTTALPIPVEIKIMELLNGGTFTAQDMESDVQKLAFAKTSFDRQEAVHHFVVKYFQFARREELEMLENELYTVIYGENDAIPRRTWPLPETLPPKPKKLNRMTSKEKVELIVQNIEEAYILYTYYYEDFVKGMTLEQFSEVQTHLQGMKHSTPKK